MAAAVSKIMSNADLIFAAKKMPVVVRSNNTIGLPGHFSSRLQPNDTRDEIPSIVAQVYEGLSYGAGDAVIGINPVTDTVENTKAMLNALWEIIERHQIPTQNCVLAHVTTQMEAIRQGANAGMIFQSIAGSEKGLREFGVTTGLLDEAYDLARHYCQATGPNVMYFETGQGSALSADAHYGCDQVTMEARCYGLARATSRSWSIRWLVLSGRNTYTTISRSSGPGLKTISWASCTACRWAVTAAIRTMPTPIRIPTRTS